MGLARVTMALWLAKGPPTSMAIQDLSGFLMKMLLGAACSKYLMKSSGARNRRRPPATAAGLIEIAADRALQVLDASAGSQQRWYFQITAGG